MGLLRENDSPGHNLLDPLLDASLIRAVFNSHQDIIDRILRQRLQGKEDKTKPGRVRCRILRCHQVLRRENGRADHKAISDAAQGKRDQIPGFPALRLGKLFLDHAPALVTHIQHASIPDAGGIDGHGAVICMNSRRHFSFHVFDVKLHAAARNHFLHATDMPDS